MITETEKKNRDKLFHLMKENPDLPVIPMVDGEICSDDYAYYLGVWGSVSVDEYLICKRYGYVAFKSDDDVFDVLEKYLTDEEFEKLPESEEIVENFMIIYLGQRQLLFISPHCNKEMECRRTQKVGGKRMNIEVIIIIQSLLLLFATFYLLNDN